MIKAQEIKLNVVPGGIIPVVHVSQYDVGREIAFKIYDGYTEASLPTGATATIEGTKPDGHGFSYSCTIDGNTVTAETTEQMTVLTGSIECKITFYYNLDRIGTAMFNMEIEKAGLDSGTDISDTEIPTIIELARQEESNSEAWANGTRGGVPVSEGDPAYHNNSKYWEEQAEQSVTGVSGVKGNAESTYRRGNVNLTPADLGALATNGDSESNTVTFTSSDDDTTTDKTSDGMTSVSTLDSGETHSSLFGKISKMFLNIRKLWNTVGETDISSIGQTVTAAIGNIGKRNAVLISVTADGTTSWGDYITGQLYPYIKNANNPVEKGIYIEAFNVSSYLFPGYPTAASNVATLQYFRTDWFRFADTNKWNYGFSNFSGDFKGFISPDVGWAIGGNNYSGTTAGTGGSLAPCIPPVGTVIRVIQTIG